MANMEKYPSVKRWISNLTPSTTTRYIFHIKKWMKWINTTDTKFKDYNPDQLILYAKNGNTEQLYELCDLIRDYIESLDKLRRGSKVTMIHTLRSFFAHNRANLPKDITYKPKGETPKVMGKLEPKHIKQIVIASNILYKAIFLVMFQGGFGNEEFTNWNKKGYSVLEEAIHVKPYGPIKVDLPGRKSKKNEYNYYTFIYGDGLNALKRYLQDIRPALIGKAIYQNKIGKISNDQLNTLYNTIFISQRSTPLKKDSLYRYWHNKVKKLGLATKNGDRIQRYGYNLHEMRDTFRTLFRKSTVPVEYAEYFMGHSNAFDRDGYDKVYRDQIFTAGKYLEASPWLQIMTSNQPFGLVNKEEAENHKFVDLQQQIDKLNETNEVLRKALQKRLEKEGLGDLKDLL